MNKPLTDLRRRLARRHHTVGWWALLAFLTLGIVLETLHGFKADLYLDPANRVRRLMWTLAHAHGTLLAVVNIAFAAGLTVFGTWGERGLKLASFFLLDALVLVPVGFFLGGVTPSEGDPASGVLLVPVGALLLFAGVAMTAWAASKSPSEPEA